MSEFKTPGVYIREIPTLPPSIASVETAIPAFIGYTEKAQRTVADDLKLIPTRITSLMEYEQYFGKAQPENGIVVDITGASPNQTVIARIDPATNSNYLLYYTMQLFFANGGGPCYIVSVNPYAAAPGAIVAAELRAGIDAAGIENEVTLLVLPESVNLTTLAQYYTTVFDYALDQCVALQDRFVVMDVFRPTGGGTPIGSLRGTLASNNKLKYGAAYYPKLFTTITYDYSLPNLVKVNGLGPTNTLTMLKTANDALYNQALEKINGLEMLLPAAPAVVGQYATTDRLRGVWKAPANVNISLAIRPEVIVTGLDQADLNVDPVAGKSINVIRSFPGRGPAIIWGARTLLGNDNEWRYVPVRRYFNMAEESAKNACEQFVFEPNDKTTWIKVKGMLINYFTKEWDSGALMGASKEEAFYVHIGLGETMSELDVWEGRMIVEIGLAVVRPAEFIILKFMHKMLGEA